MKLICATCSQNVSNKQIDVTPTCTYMIIYIVVVKLVFIVMWPALHKADNNMNLYGKNIKVKVCPPLV